MGEKEIGLVTHYFSNLSVAAIEITEGTLIVGDLLHFTGHTTDCQSKAESIQLQHQFLTEAAKGSEVGVKIAEKVRKGDRVYRIVAD